MDISSGRGLADVLLAEEQALAAGWCARFRTAGTVPVLAQELLHRVLVALTPDSAGAADPALAEASYGLGVLRAQQGRDTASLVEDVLALRPHLWAHLAALPDVQGDVAMLLLLQGRLAEVLDMVLRATVAAHVEEAQRVLQRRATRDPLTGLLNRAAFEDALEREVAGADREEPPALLLIDLDGFKQVNDTKGHLAGDAVLVQVARLLEQAVRTSDVVARLGGDEFAVLLPRTSRSTGMALARRLLLTAGQEDSLQDRVAPIGFSVGVAWTPAPRSGAELVAAADGAMYRAKRQGGSGVTAAESPACAQPEEPVTLAPTGRP